MLLFIILFTSVFYMFWNWLSNIYRSQKPALWHLSMLHKQKPLPSSTVYWCDEKGNYLEYYLYFQIHTHDCCFNPLTEKDEPPNFLKTPQQWTCQRNIQSKILLLIASAKFWSARGASHQPAFMNSCLTIRHTCLPCLPSGRTLVIYLLLGEWWAKKNGRVVSKGGENGGRE